MKKFRDAVQANAELKNRHELEALRKALLKEPLEFFQQAPRSASGRPGYAARRLVQLGRCEFRPGFAHVGDRQHP